MRPRVQRASGIPCALWILKAGSFWHRSGAMRREIAKLYPPSFRGARSANPESIVRQSWWINGFRACAKWRIPE